MSEEKKATNNQPVKTPSVAATVAKDIYGGSRGPRQGGNRSQEKRDEFEQRILDIARVTRVMAGGKRMNFRACVAIGDKKGKIAVGVGKGADVTMAVNKAVNKAKKDMISVSSINETITHAIYHKEGAAKLLFKPARQGRGVIAGGVARVIFELAGIKNVTCKQLGTNNKLNNARCVIEALRQLRPFVKVEKVAKVIKEDQTIAKA